MEYREGYRDLGIPDRRIIYAIILIGIVAVGGYGVHVYRDEIYEELKPILEYKGRHYNRSAPIVNVTLPSDSTNETQISTIPVTSAYISYNEDCAKVIVSWIDEANESIYVMMYSFTLEEIASSLVEAHERGVEVHVIMEPQQISDYSQIDVLSGAGIDVFLDDHEGIMHHKVCVIDGYVVLTGSVNYSVAGMETNSENLVVIISEEIGRQFISEYRRLRG